MSTKRHAILEAATDLLYREGFAEIGVDRFVAEAGVALGTFYRHFRTRSAMIAATLAHRHRAFIEALAASKSDDANDEPVLALFDALGAWSTSQGGNGCYFLRAAADYPRDPGIRDAALAHKAEYRAIVEERLRQGGRSAAQIELLAPAIFVLLEGAVAAAFTLGDARAIASARETAALLLARHAPRP
jgi:AcrR family transcriptional regulator